MSSLQPSYNMTSRHKMYNLKERDIRKRDEEKIDIAGAEEKDQRMFI